MNAALKKSYELEKKGLEFYVSSAVKCQNALAKRTLFSLAQEEIKHMMKIDDISLAVGQGKKWRDVETRLKTSDIEMEIKTFFGKTGKEILGSDKDNSVILKKAMEFERQSYELYSELSAKSDQPEEKSFYDELKGQEKEHFAALENAYYYLTKTGDWFEKEESGVWGWMSL